MPQHGRAELPIADAGHRPPTPGPRASVPAGSEQRNFCRLQLTRRRARPGQAPEVTPPPIPTPTPNPYPSAGPIFLVRGGETPPPITPAGTIDAPADARTDRRADARARLRRGDLPIRVRRQPRSAANRATRSATCTSTTATKRSSAKRRTSTAIRTITITGHPFIINHERDSVLTADEIDLRHGRTDREARQRQRRERRGRTARPRALQRRTICTPTPTARRTASIPYVTTCENPRGGYHITGKTMDVYPGDKIVINKAVSVAGRGGCFLPAVVGHSAAQRRRPARATRNGSPRSGTTRTRAPGSRCASRSEKISTTTATTSSTISPKLGLGLGYVGFYASKRGRRSVSVNLYTLNNRAVGHADNLTLQEQENFSQHLRGNFQFAYQSNYGRCTNIPPNETLGASVVHQTQKTSQNY